MTAFKQHVVSAFDAAADYDRLAGIQQQVAQALAQRIGPLAAGTRVLEVGCGTGFVAAALPEQGADWLMTDVSPAMIERSRHRFRGRPSYRFAVLDAENLRFKSPEAPFDLICSSLAAQWFEDLPETLARLYGFLKPGGRLLVSTLADGTFAEWRAAHETLGLKPGTPDYPNRSALEAMRLDGRPGLIEIERFTSSYESGRAFVRTLRSIGAATPRPDHRPLSPHRMRSVLRTFEEAGAKVSWEVAFCTFQRPEAGQ